MSFFNQFLVPDLQEDDLLDPLAAEYARRSSSRGTTSIQLPRSPVAATSATSSAATNPVPGPTALAPQLSLGWPAKNPQFSPAQAGQTVQGQPQAPISGTPAMPVPQPQPQPMQRKSPVRSAVSRPAARSDQRSVPLLRPNAPATQSATPGTTTSVVPHSTWRYIAEHPELPEYAPLYEKALNQLSPEEKLAIRNKRIAAYPENQPEELEPIIDPEMGVQMGMRDVGPKAQAAMAQYSPVPQSAMPALATAKKYAVDPFERMSAASGRIGKDMLVGGAAAMVEGTSVPQPGDAVDPESGLPLPNPEDYQPEKIEKFRREYPRTAGVLGAIGETGGSIVGDPRMWPFFFTGPEAADGRFLSRSTSSTLSRAASAGFATQMAVGSAHQAAQIREIWVRPDIPLDEKYEALAGLVLNSIMAAHGTASVVRGKTVPKPQPLDAQLAAEINALGAEAKQQIFSRLDQKLRQQEALKNQTAPAPAPRTPVHKPAAPVRKPSAPSGQIASVLSRPDISRGQKHDLIADSILGELIPETAGRNAAPPKPPVTQLSDDPADAMRRYMVANGELPPTPKEAPPRPQLALDPQKIAEIGPQLAPLAHADQQGVLVNLHDKLSQAIAAQKKILGPDGQLHIVNSPAEAGKLAQQFINDSITKHDEQVAEQQKVQPQSVASQIESPGRFRSQQNTQPVQQREITPDSVPSTSSAAAKNINHSAERLPSSDDAARIDPNFRLDPTNANLMHYEVVRRQGTVPPYIRLNHIAYQIIAGIRGKSFDGLNVPLDRAQEIIAKIREQAAGESSAVTRRRLHDLARTLTRISSKEDGLSMVRKTGSPEVDFRAIQEELFHSVVQRRPGKGNIAAGTPHEVLATEPKLQKMQERIREETGSNDPITFVVEAIHDVWANEARELSPEEQSAVAEKYWEEFAKKVGDESLVDASQLWKHLQSLARNEYNVNAKEVMNDRAYRTLEEVIARRTRAQGEAVQGTDQPPHQRIPLQHRGRQETQGNSGEGEEPEGEPGTGPGEVERLPIRQGNAGHEEKAQTVQRVIAGRIRPQGEAVQGTNQPVDQGILLQHRQSQEAGRNSGEGEEPRTASGTVRGEVEPENLERPPATGHSVFLPDGRKATIQFISPAMKVARVHTADGQTRTIKLSELQPARTRPIADMRNVPEMGHNMTADAPSVRRAKAEAAPLRGQTPTIKVKQEPAEVQAALTQPPAPVRAADAARVGQRDPQSGRTILQPSNDLVQNERLANQAAPELNTRLSRVTVRVDGAKFDRLRPQKGLQRLQEKVADGKPANTIGDNLAAQIVAPSVKAKNRIIAELHREFPVISVDDKFLEPREKAGYPSANVQVRMRNGSTAEVQIVAPEIQNKTDLTHRLYTLGRNYPEGSPERAYYWAQAAAIHTQALERFKARTAQEQFVSQLVPGQRVVLTDGKTGKIVGFSKKFDRVTVETHDGTKTVKPGDLSPVNIQIESAVPAKTTKNALARNAAANYETFRRKMASRRGVTDFSEAEKSNSLEGEKYSRLSRAEKEPLVQAQTRTERRDRSQNLHASGRSTKATARQ